MKKLNELEHFKNRQEEFEYKKEDYEKEIRIERIIQIALITMIIIIAIAGLFTINHFIHESIVELIDSRVDWWLC